jgi:4,5-dihydroxyphthalate decarboxylase
MAADTKPTHRLAAHPELAPDVFGAFAAAKRLSVERLKAGAIAKPTPVDALHRCVLEITGDPLPYGIGPSRRVLEELLRHALTQRIITQPVAVDELFAPGTLGLVA